MGAVARNGVEDSLLQVEGTAERHLDRFSRSGYFPGIGPNQPVVRVFDLEAFLDRLPENAVFVTQAIAHRRDPERGERIDEAGRQAPEPAIAQTGIGFLFEQREPVEILLLD